MTVEYPPLTPVDALPLHPYEGQPGITYACQRTDLSPESSYDWRCRDCVARAEDLLYEHGANVPPHILGQPGEGESIAASLDWMVARSRTFLGPR